MTQHSELELDGILIWSPEDHKVVAQLSEPLPDSGLLDHESLRYFSPNFREALERADFIVRAANSHYQMKKALGAWMEQVNRFVNDDRDLCDHCGKQNPHTPDCPITLTKAALKLARGEE